MSKGLSKLQRAIVGLLDGTVKRQVYGAGPATTDELLAELQELGMVREDTPRKRAMFTVRRACISLLDRGILEGEYVSHDPYHWAKVLLWRLVEQAADKTTAKPKPKAKGKGR